MCVNDLPEVALNSAAAGTEAAIFSATRQPLSHRATLLIT